MTLPYQQREVRGDVAHHLISYSESVSDPVGERLRIPLFLLFNLLQLPSIISRNMSVTPSLVYRDNFGASLLHPPFISPQQ